MSCCTGRHAWNENWDRIFSGEKSLGWPPVYLAGIGFFVGRLRAGDRTAANLSAEGYRSRNGRGASSGFCARNLHRCAPINGRSLARTDANLTTNTCSYRNTGRYRHSQPDAFACAGRPGRPIRRLIRPILRDTPRPNGLQWARPRLPKSFPQQRRRSLAKLSRLSAALLWPGRPRLSGRLSHSWLHSDGQPLGGPGTGGAGRCRH